MPASRFVGLISGTSMDAIDAALVEIECGGLRLIETHGHPWPSTLIERIRAVAQSDNTDLDELGELDALAGDCFAEAAISLLRKAGQDAETVAAIGSHGQTLRHRPDLQPAYTLQIGDPNRIAQRTGITTIADFRRRDMAAGGQGAPLVPAFHAACLSHPEEHRIVLNVGGIANITTLPAKLDNPASEPVKGFDTGPGNCLLDAWVSLKRKLPFDRNGEWAATGKPIAELLQHLLADPYFQLPAPKSTGTEYFSHSWLREKIQGFRDADPADIQATLLRLTVDSIAGEIRNYAPRTRRVLVCGGGVHNQSLMRQLSESLSPVSVGSTGEFDLDPDWIEAMAFAWLAERTLRRAPGNLPSVTGATQPVVLGAVYPG